MIFGSELFKTSFNDLNNLLCSTYCIDWFICYIKASQASQFKMVLKPKYRDMKVKHLDNNESKTNMDNNDSSSDMGKKGNSHGQQ